LLSANVFYGSSLTPTLVRAQSSGERQADIQEAITEILALKEVIDNVVKSKKITFGEAEARLATARKRLTDFYYNYGGESAGNGRYEKKYGKRTDYDSDVHHSARVAGGVIALTERDDKNNTLSCERRRQLKSNSKDLGIYVNHLKTLRS